MDRVGKAEMSEDLVFRLRKRAEIRRQIPGRKSVQAGEPDRIADLLEEAADEIEKLNKTIKDVKPCDRDHGEDIGPLDHWLE